MKYLKNPGVVFSPFYGSGSWPRYLCEIPREDGSTRRYLIEAELSHLLPLFDGTKSMDAVFSEHKLAYPESRHTVAGLKKFVDSYCIPHSILVDASRNPNPAAASSLRTAPVGRYMYARFKLLPHKAIYPIVRRLSWLYSRPAFILFVSLAVLTHVWLYWQLLPASRFNMGGISGQQLLAMTALLIAAAFCHELGHATALARHGCQHLQIGFGLYLYLPVLYTDVSEAWRLKPSQRVQVDAGGVYFHAISQLALLAGFYIWHKIVFLYAIFMIDVTITSSLNPFLRMDGYWLLSDLCGMWNLRKQSLDLGRYFWRRLTGRGPLPDLSDISPRSLKILTVYSIIFAFFFSYLVTTLAYQLMVNVIPGYPGLWLRLGHDILHPASLDTGQWLTRIFELLWKTFLIIGCSLFVKNALRRAFAWWTNRRQQEASAFNTGMTARVNE